MLSGTCRRGNSAPRRGTLSSSMAIGHHRGGSIMKGRTIDETMMIASSSDGTRPVIFKIERIDVE